MTLAERIAAAQKPKPFDLEAELLKVADKIQALGSQLVEAQDAHSLAALERDSLEAKTSLILREEEGKVTESKIAALVTADCDVEASRSATTRLYRQYVGLLTRRADAVSRKEVLLALVALRVGK